jgi:hypothetical protein
MPEGPVDLSRAVGFEFPSQEVCIRHDAVYHLRSGLELKTHSTPRFRGTREISSFMHLVLAQRRMIFRSYTVRLYIWSSCMVFATS